MQDLDLHVVIPGERDVKLKQFENGTLDNSDYAFAGSMGSAGAFLKSSFTWVTKKFSGTDLGRSKTIQDDEFRIYWDQVGYKEHYPYAKYELDHGSHTGVSEGGGPEVVRIFKELPKQYLVSVDCWSCDEYEDEYELDQKRELTKQSLHEFYRESFATVSIHRGDEQVQCANIASATGQPSTMWDAFLLDNMAGSNTQSTLTRKVTALNQFSKYAPTLNVTYPGMTRAQSNFTIADLGLPRVANITSDTTEETKPSVAPAAKKEVKSSIFRL